MIATDGRPTISNYPGVLAVCEAIVDDFSNLEHLRARGYFDYEPRPHPAFGGEQRCEPRPLNRAMAGYITDEQIDDILNGDDGRWPLDGERDEPDYEDMTRGDDDGDDGFRPFDGER